MSREASSSARSRHDFVPTAYADAVTTSAWVTSRWQRHEDLLFPSLCLTAGIGAVAFAASDHASAVQLDVVRLAAWATGPIAGALILDRRPGDPLGRLLAASGLFPVLALVVAAWEQRTLPDIASAAAQIPVLVIPTVAFLIALLLWFPDSEMARSAERLGRATAAVALVGLAAAAWRAARPGPSLHAGIDPLLSGIEYALLAGLLTALGAAVAMQVRETITATGLARRRRLWLLVALTVIALSAISLSVFGSGAGAAYAAAALQAMVPFVVALLLLSIDLPPVGFSLGQAAVGLALAGAVTAVFDGSRGALARTQLPDPESAAVVLAALAAAGAIPLYAALRRHLAVRFLGVGRQPGSLLALLGESLRAEGEAEDALRAACDAVARAVRSPAATVRRHDARLAADDGTVAVPLVASGEPVGMLVVAPRRPGEPFHKRDQALIATLAAPVAQVARAGRLAAALEQARSDIAAQRLDERRRLRRDLHDGLGPLLASLALHAQAMARAHPETTEDVERIRGTLAASRAEVRRLVDGLAPEAATTGDLRQSIEELVEGWASAAAPSGLSVRLDLCSEVPPVSEEVRVTAYRIVGEALTNVVRHAKATECDVRLRTAAGCTVVLEICDNGTGVGEGASGFGIRSMGERASAVGGTVEFSTASGTLVRLSVPALQTAT